MEKLNFNITIDAPRQKVWEVLWNDQSYREWTTVFGEGSRVETDWKKGSKVLFMGSAQDGMLSMINDIRANEFMSFKHLGMIENGVEDVSSEKVKQWAGAMENYTLEDKNGKTELTVDMDITAEHKEQFQKIFPQALEIVKRLAEKNNVPATSNV